MINETICRFDCRWIRFYDMNWKEKIDIRNETFNKNEMWMQKNLIKLVKIYVNNNVFFKSCNDIFKSWDEMVNLSVELLNILTEFMNICDEHHVLMSSNNDMKYWIMYWTLELMSRSIKLMCWSFEHMWWTHRIMYCTYEMKYWTHHIMRWNNWEV